jgi:hypothetical protein
MPDDARLHWLVRPKTIRMLWIAGSVILVLVTLAGVLIPGHPHFAIEHTFGFFSWYGFVTCAAMVIFAKFLGFFLKRKDTYYEPD